MVRVSATLHIQVAVPPRRLNVADGIGRMPQLAGPQLAVVTWAQRVRDAPPADMPGAIRVAPDHLELLTDRLQKGYTNDEWFSHAENTESLRSLQGLWWLGKAVLVPDYDGLRAELMYLFHETPYAGHTGVNRTTKALQQHYRWPKMDADIKAYVRACAKCQVSKPEGGKPAGLLQPLPIPGKFWHKVSMDLITHLPVTARGNTAIVVFVDRLSKMTHLAATRDTVDSQVLARLMIDNVVRLHGVPAEWIFDRDVRVTSAFSQDFYSILKVRQRMSTAFHPKTDGQTERMNRVLEEMLRAFVAPSLDDWDQHLSLCEFAINSHENESVRKSPLLYGSNPRVPATVDFDTAQSQATGEAQPAEAGLSAAARTVA